MPQYTHKATGSDAIRLTAKQSRKFLLLHGLLLKKWWYVFLQLFKAKSLGNLLLNTRIRCCYEKQQSIRVFIFILLSSYLTQMEWCNIWPQAVQFTTFTTTMFPYLVLFSFPTMTFRFWYLVGLLMFFFTPLPTLKLIIPVFYRVYPTGGCWKMTEKIINSGEIG